MDTNLNFFIYFAAENHALIRMFPIDIIFIVTWSILDSFVVD